MNPSKTQHRIREDVDFCTLKIDDGFVGEMKAFRVSSPSFVAEQRRSAMTIV